ncbi:PAS domain S-box protein [Rubrivivax benzoatilyticus]|uniref:histidine kinase n=1 Tax=Rubrivivax benzoatilyticus TaxID=316997 RepID=A0ABX0HZX5_9BURK|nr:PAS domain S-box protein [Rubrivivax benzoatilyticus]NHK99118.1 PAS domain S-box protein [Rubrivivax benzoatilyticus]NHL25019.1 PAS domain S-box protein [Rubrivivax benzoatilyticus]
MNTAIEELGQRLRQERIALALLLLAVALVLAWARVRARDDALEAEGARLADQASAVREVLALQVGATRSALIALRSGLAGPTGAAPLRAFAAATPQVGDVLRLDAAGRVLASSRDIPAGATVPVLPASRDPDLLYLLPPDEDERGRRRLLMLLTMPDGGWLGTELDAAHAEAVLGAVRYAPDMQVSLAHGGGRLLLSVPPVPGQAGVDLARSSPAFAAHRGSGRNLSVQRARSVLSGDERLFALATLRAPQLPLGGDIEFGTSRRIDAVLEPWRTQTLLAAAAFLLVSALVAAGLVVMQRRQRLALEQLRVQSERLSLALRGADLGLWDNDWTRDHGTVNERWCEILGLPPSDGRDMRAVWIERLHPDDRDSVLEAERRHLEGHSPAYEVLYRLRHADGRWIWVLDRGKVLQRDADGRPLRMAGTLLDIDTRMREQQALAASERRLAITLRSIGDGVVVTDRDGCVTRMNTMAERLTGWSEADALGRPLTEVFRIVNQRTGEPVPNPAEQVIATGRIVALANDTALLARDGRRLYIEDSAAPIPGDDGGVTGVVLVFSDVTERYVARQALRERERLLAGITDALPGPVARLDLDGRYRFASAAYRDWFGLDPATVVGRSIPEVLGEPLHRFGLPYLRRVRAGEAVRFDLPMKTADGQQRHALVTLLPDRDADGTVCGHFAVTFDIGELKRTEEALRASERRLRALLDNLMTGVVVHEPDLRVREANAAALAMLGLADQQALRDRPEADWQVVDELGEPLTHDELPAPRVRRSGRRIADMVIGLRRPDGRQLWALCNAVPLVDDDGRLESIVVAFADITARREAERLERRLRDTQKMEAIGTLAGGIAHDFNNILAGILGRLTLAREDAAASRPVHEHLDQAMQAGLRAVALVRKILEFSRGETGAMTLQPAAPVIEETLGMLRAMVPPGVQLQAVLPADPVAVRVDGTQLQQVLLNLATNAWHALPAIGGRVEVGLERLDAAQARALGEPALAEGPVAHLWVRDDGHGIAPDVLSRIFEPFYTTKPVGKGTGLGLSVVHGIVLAHGGAIRVDSRLDAGSTFHVYLPSPEAPEPAPPPVVGTSAAPRPAASGAHVLLVDDDPIVAAVHGQLLRRAGYRVQVCDSGREALALLERSPDGFDAVVTDHNMPDTSGVELARRIVQVAPALPVLLCSGFVDDALHAQAAEAGVRVVVPKEDAYERLVPALATVLAAGGGS